MSKKLMQKTFRFIWRLGLSGLFVLAFVRIVIVLIAGPKTFSVDDIPVRRVAIVFGAEVKKDGTPSAVLRDRVETAVALYKNGKVEKLLMSGDNRFVDYNEPEAMRQYAVSLGVPDEAIVLDYAGRRTYDTCYRAKEIFQVDSAIPHRDFTCRARCFSATPSVWNRLGWEQTTTITSSGYVWSGTSGRLLPPHRLCGTCMLRIRCLCLVSLNRYLR